MSYWYIALPSSLVAWIMCCIWCFTSHMYMMAVSASYITEWCPRFQAEHYYSFGVGWCFSYPTIHQVSKENQCVFCELRAISSVLRIQDVVTFLFQPQINCYKLPFSVVYRTFPYPESRAEGSHPTPVYSSRCESDDTQPQSDTIPWARRLWHQTRHCNHHRHSAG